MSKLNTKNKILLVDDDKHILSLMKIRFESQGYEVEALEDPVIALNALKCTVFDLVVTDLKMTSLDGIALLDAVKSINPKVPVILMTAYGSIETAIEATKKGVFSYITKPFDPRNLLLMIEKALEKQRLEEKVEFLQKMIETRYGVSSILTCSDKMDKVIEKTLQAATTYASVAIYGESGVGKELIAKITHLNSNRKDGPFVAVNCGAFSEGLLENELFGHVKGAFTGAHDYKEGLLGRANQGTLILDEIAEFPLSLQPKLLRVLQDYEYYPLGSASVKKVDFRLITMTNKNLMEEVERGAFRRDLYYRIHVIPINIPPLRERKEDIPLLVEYFIKMFVNKQNKSIRGITKTAMQRLVLYDWPGNVREIKNVIEYAVTMAKKSMIDESDLFAFQHEVDISGFPSYKTAKKSFDRNYIIQALKITRGNVSRAASLSKKTRAEFYKLMAKEGIDPDNYKG